MKIETAKLTALLDTYSLANVEKQTTGLSVIKTHNILPRKTCRITIVNKLKMHNISHAIETIHKQYQAYKGLTNTIGETYIPLLDTVERDHKKNIVRSTLISLRIRKQDELSISLEFDIYSSI